MTARSLSSKFDDVCEPLCNVCGESASVYVSGHCVTTGDNAAFTHLAHCDEHAAELRRDPLCQIDTEEPVA